VVGRNLVVKNPVIDSETSHSHNNLLSLWKSLTTVNFVVVVKGSTRISRKEKYSKC